MQAKILAALDQPAYLLRARSIYVVITALAMLWVYLTVLVWGGPPMQAVFAAALVGNIMGDRLPFVLDRLRLRPDAICRLDDPLEQPCSPPSQRRKVAGPGGYRGGSWRRDQVHGGTLLLPVLIAAYAVRGRLPAGQSAVGTIAKILVSFAVTFLVSTPVPCFNLSVRLGCSLRVHSLQQAWAQRTTPSPQVSATAWGSSNTWAWSCSLTTLRSPLSSSCWRSLVFMPFYVNPAWPHSSWSPSRSSAWDS